MYKTTTYSRNPNIICAKGLDVRVSVLYYLKFLAVCSCVCVNMFGSPHSTDAERNFARGSLINVKVTESKRERQRATDETDGRGRTGRMSRLVHRCCDCISGMLQSHERALRDAAFLSAQKLHCPPLCTHMHR